MSQTVTASIYEPPNGSTAQLQLLGVTNSGTVFGYQGAAGFIATADGSVTLVDVPGYPDSQILGLNASGTVGYGFADGSGSSYFIDDDGTLTLLPLLDTPIGVDDAGEVLVDGPEVDGGPSTSFLIKDGVIEPVALPTANSVATAISSGGVIAGTTGSSGAPSYFVETASGTAIYAYPPFSDGSTYRSGEAPTAVNNAGEVGLANGSGDAILVQNGSVVASLQDLGRYGNPAIISLNNEGQGVVVDFGESVDNFFTVLSTSGTTEVVFPGNSYPSAFEINDAGEIVGNTLVEGNPSDNSTYKTFAFTAELPCFAAGTLIETAHGPSLVEALRPGDLVRTAGGALRPVTWTGGRVVDLATHPDPALARPVVIRAGAFGLGLPRRDLVVSPDHAIAWGDVLIPAKCLVDGVRVAIDADATVVSYHHIELAEHDLLLAEALAVESFLDTGNRHALAGGAGDPDFSTAPDRAWFEWEARGCRRLVLAGPELAAARSRLLAVS